MNILFFDDLGGLFCFFCILLNVFCSDRSADGLVVFWQSSAGLLKVFCWSSTGLLVVFCQSSACLLVVFCLPSASLQKMNILFFDDLGGLFHFFAFQWPVSDCSADHQNQRNPKMNILFFDDLGGLFHFFAFWSTFFAQIAQPIIRS